MLHNTEQSQNTKGIRDFRILIEDSAFLYMPQEYDGIPFPFPRNDYLKDTARSKTNRLFSRL